MESDSDSDIVDPQKALQAGIDAGHIHIQNHEDGEDGDFNITLMSAHAQAAQQKHESLLKSIEEKRLKQNLRVPTDDNEVKQRLRALQEPICYFGEDAADRRDRLRDLIAKMISSGQQIPEFRKDRKQLEIDLATIADKINKDRPYFSAGNPWIKVARTRILQYSLKKAAKRVGIQLKQREDPLPPIKMKEEEHINRNKLSSFSCQASYYDKSDDSRPLQCCAISNHLVTRRENASHYAILFGNQGGDITVWNEYGQMKKKIHGHDERITGMDIMPFKDGVVRSYDAIKFITSSADGLAKLWSVNGDALGVYDAYSASNKHKRGSAQHKQRLGKCAFHPIGDYFAVTSYDRSWSFFDIEKQDIVLLKQEGHSTSVHCCGFHCDGSLIATGDMGGIVRIWDLRSGRAIWGGDSHAKSVLGVDFNVNGYILASCASDNTIKIWDLRKHTEYTIPAHDNLISNIQFEPNKGEWMVSASFDKTVRIWSMKKRGSYSFKLAHQMKGHHSRISDLCISDGGEDSKPFIVTASHDKTWKIWTDHEFGDGSEDEQEHRSIKQEHQVMDVD
eukprot:217326_1